MSILKDYYERHNRWFKNHLSSVLVRDLPIKFGVSAISSILNLFKINYSNVGKDNSSMYLKSKWNLWIFWIPRLEVGPCAERPIEVPIVNRHCQADLQKSEIWRRCKTRNSFHSLSRWLWWVHLWRDISMQLNSSASSSCSCSSSSVEYPK